jgi:esterase/lipase superfamily enzyme
MELILYGHGGDPVLLFPTSFGNMMQNEDFGLVGAIGDRLDYGRYTVACVDGLDRSTWYNKGIHPRDRVRYAAAYEAYIFAEVLPLLWSRTGYGRELTFGGCSFGAFHALNMAFRHAGVVDKLLAMSGKYDTAGFLDGYHDDNVYFHTAKEWLPNLRDPHILHQMYGMNIILAAGEHDICRGANEEMSGTLWSKGIGNHLSIWDGAVHDWPVWCRMMRHFMH